MKLRILNTLLQSQQRRITDHHQLILNLFLNVSLYIKTDVFSQFLIQHPRFITPPAWQRFYMSFRLVLSRVKISSHVREGEGREIIWLVSWFNNWFFYHTTSHTHAHKISHTGYSGSCIAGLVYLDENKTKHQKTKTRLFFRKQTMKKHGNTQQFDSQ